MVVPSVSAMATAAAAPASVAPSLAPKANDSRKAVVPVDTSELEKHVLAVDDKSVDRAAIARILRGSRYRVTAVESATRALELLAMGLLPDVSMIITDYWMPGMTGYELLKRVKESAALRGHLRRHHVVYDHRDLYIFKQNFTIALIAFYASTKKQVPHSSLQNRSLIYAKICIHLRCFGSRLTLKST